ncbi:hypothetical protein OG521_03755 [Streptomyces sp. NBC_01463]|uniref:hypothetical protein n=1 Tax=Streptomyces sp. NBC_01104 TaxID=2903750 RepID=UPI00324ED667|nr:hypothetical protein OG450_36360 [Streptomyces sp. NBC_01104]
MRRTASRGLVRLSLALGAAVASTALVTTASAALPVTAGSTGPPVAPRTGTERGCVVVYFDLGETLVHTADDATTGYRQDAADHLAALRKRHIKVGLITNVPSSWGTTDAARAAVLKKEVDSTWTGSTPFAWDDFGDRILTPRTEAERKPAPALWERARHASGGCRLVYQAETAEETDTAASLGYVAYRIGQPARPAFLPAPLIELLAHLPG